MYFTLCNQCIPEMAASRGNARHTHTGVPKHRGFCYISKYGYERFCVQNGTWYFFILFYIVTDRNRNQKSSHCLSFCVSHQDPNGTHRLVKLLPQNETVCKLSASQPDRQLYRRKRREKNNPNSIFTREVVIHSH